VSERSHDLASKFEQMSAEVVRFTEGCSEREWRTHVPDEDRSVAYLCSHIALGYVAETQALKAMVSGEQTPNWSWEDLAQRNAQRWQAEPYPDQAETVARLRDATRTTAEAICVLTEEQLELPGSYGPIQGVGVVEFVERVILGHPRGHLDAMRRVANGDVGFQKGDPDV